jgi:hypothetical protein
MRSMSSAQIADVFRLICVVSSALTLLSVIGYFSFARVAEKERTAQISQLASANQSLSSQLAEHADLLRQKELLIAQAGKERAAALESEIRRREIAERERVVSDEEALMLLGPTSPPSAPAPPAEIRRPVVSDRSTKITPERHHELVAALRSVPPSDVEFLFNDSDPEATTLARQLSSMLAEAGFQRRVMPPPGKKFEWSPPVSGIRVAIAEGRPVPPMVTPLTSVLKRSGIQVDGVVNPNVPKTDKPLVWIIIGTNPSAEG